MGIPFQNTYARLPERFFSEEAPVKVPGAELVRVNEGLAAELGIEAGVEVFSGNVVPEGAEPISQVYAGHQFGGFVPRLGDGRAILLGEVLHADGRLRDVQLKGAGRTAFSRGGDGRSALGPVLREYIVSEAMYALGVPTTRALAAVSTGEVVAREEPVPGGVFTRVAGSHVRVGTFQYFAAQRDVEGVRELMDYCMARHYPGAGSALEFLECVVEAQAKLVAKWLPLGFIHGVMNTDNCSISGETIDYGPCAFMDDFHPDCVFSYIDRNARYAWGNQPTICHWNMTRLAETLLPLIDEDAERGKELAQAVLGKFVGIFQDAYLENFRAKLGVVDSEGFVGYLKSTLGMLAKEEVDFTLFFRHLTLLAGGDERGDVASLFQDGEVAERWLEEWRGMEKVDVFLERMKAVNPVLIPRNHRIEEVIQAAYGGDFSLFHRMVDALERPYEDRAEYADLEKAPLPNERVANTFCGT
ncbi:MAG: protein adenylyltransferase SelO [Luteolibacter sp.]